MVSKKIIYSHDARKELVIGMNILAKAVSITLGPKGKNIILESKLSTPRIVNDGVTIAKEVELSNIFQNMGVVLIREAALKTNEVVGDGTTTTTVLAYAIIKEGMKKIASGSNPILLKKGLEKAVRFVVNKITEYSRPVFSLQELRNVASVSAGNNPKMGDLISEAVSRVGAEGMISLEDSHSLDVSLEVQKGINFQKGYISKHFLLREGEIEISQENPLILLTDQKIRSVKKELVPFLEKVAITGRSLLILAEDISKEALSTLILNKSKGVIDVVAVGLPGLGDSKKDLLEDIAILVNGTIISEAMGLSLDKVSLDLMGSAQHITVSKNKTTIISGVDSSIIKSHCLSIRRQIELSNNIYEKDKLQNRLVNLSSGVATIKIGAATLTEFIDMKLRLEDAINSTKAALEEGIVPGGGSTLAHLSILLQSWSEKHLSSDEFIGAQILVNALLVPLHTIIYNAGYNSTIVIEHLNSTSFDIGYDAESNKFVNMYEAGIIDSSKVTRLALQNASSIAAMILTTGCIINSNMTQDLESSS